MKTDKERIEKAEAALAEESDGNIMLWNVPDAQQEREYWKQVWLKGYDKAGEEFRDRLKFAEKLLVKYADNEDREGHGMHSNHRDEGEPRSGWSV